MFCQVFCYDSLNSVDDSNFITVLYHVVAVSGSQQRPKWWVGGGAEWAAPLQELAGWALAGGGEGAGAAALRALYLAPEPALQLLAPDPQHMRKVTNNRLVGGETQIYTRKKFIVKRGFIAKKLYKSLHD